MDPLTIATAIGFATRLIELANRAIDAANNGDLEKAEEYLKQSRVHFDNAFAEWHGAEQPDEDEPNTS